METDTNNPAFNRLTRIMNSLVGKHIKFNMKNGDTLKAYLKEILPTELIVSSTKTDKKVGIIPTESISYMLELEEGNEWTEGE